MKIFKVSLLVLLLALALPGVAFAAGLSQDTPAGGFTIPEVFGVALLGVLTYWVVEGLKLAFPQLTGFGPQIAAVVVAMVLTQITSLVNLFVPPTFYTLITDVLIIAAAWLVANGTKRIEKNVRKALKPPVAAAEAPPV